MRKRNRRAVLLRPQPENRLALSEIAENELIQGGEQKNEKPFTLTSLQTMRHVIPEKHNGGGSGANFIVTWTADKPVNPPIVESIMISTQSQQRVSFTSRGRVLLPTD
ncbi:MAG: DUF3124 domain-containing protein [Thermodesulfobacteriota bacterium]|nr:DUF3124 domain-containing protein [Thermodesulfobacteriota bacterium]